MDTERFNLAADTDRCALLLNYCSDSMNLKLPTVVPKMIMAKAKIVRRAKIFILDLVVFPQTEIPWFYLEV